MALEAIFRPIVPDMELALDGIIHLFLSICERSTAMKRFTSGCKRLCITGATMEHWLTQVCHSEKLSVDLQEELCGKRRLG